VLELRFTARDLAYTRFAISPLWELVAAVRVLKGGADRVLHQPWLDQVTPRLSTVDWQLFADLVPVPTRFLPVFLAPPPTAPVPDLDVELATLRATPHARLRAAFERIPEIRTPATAVLLDDPDAGLARLVEQVRAVWAAVLEQFWPRIRTLAETDVLHRARRLTTHGAAALFAGLEPSARWSDDRLWLTNHRLVSGRRGLRGLGLLLVPSVFVWPQVLSVTTPDWQPTLRYPPRGIATLWETGTRATPAALAGVLGHGRATLLAELTAPAATIDLAGRTGLSPSGVSQHLTALRAAGLVTAHRSGRFVLYARSSAGEALVTAAT
jgi:uncharacterized protein DUF5937/regulatory ArsR family protein